MSAGCANSCRSYITPRRCVIFSTRHWPPPGRQAGMISALSVLVSLQINDDASTSSPPRHAPKNTHNRSFASADIWPRLIIATTPTDDMRPLRDVAVAEMAGRDRKCLIAKAEQQVRACVRGWQTFITPALLVSLIMKGQLPFFTTQMVDLSVTPLCRPAEMPRARYRLYCSWLSCLSDRR